jgi:hypothetical protein
VSAYDVKRIEKPPYFGIRPLRQGRSKRIPFVVGFDSEADASKPFLFQFSEQGTTEDECYVVSVADREHAGLRAFMDYVVNRLMPRHFARTHEIIIYGFNLAYEWTQIFHDLTACHDLPEFVLPLTYAGMDFEITVYNDKRVFAKIEHPSTKLTIRVLDAQMTYKTSLDNAAKMLGLGEKYATDHEPCGLLGRWHESGHEREFIDRSLADDPEFLTYARRDAYITRLVGEQIIGMHEAYDIRQTISAPHFASSVFKRQYLSAEVALPETALEQLGLWSYHGGKNGYYLPGPARIDDCYQVDITSAYPEAMRQLPNIETADWREVHRYKEGRHAVYQATLQYTRCQYRGMMTFDGAWPDSGYIEDVAITSYELDEMVRRGEVRVITCRGWEMVGEPGGPLAAFVDTFFSQKATATGAAREAAKLLLNSLYGKFFQKVALGTVGYYDFDTGVMVEHNPEGAFDYKAGGLYHPPIASLITGFVRAKIHGMEHRFESIMTSTDGMFCHVAPDPGEIGKALGQLTVERGDLAIYRERLYIFRSPDLPKPKVAYHGFWGSLTDLETIPLAHGTYGYQSRHMVTLKESLHRFAGIQYPPGSFIEVDRSITL